MNGISPWVGKLCLYLILCYVLTSGHYSLSCNLTGSYVLCQLFVKAEWIFQDDELIEWVEEKDSVVSRISDNTVFILAKFQNNTVGVLPWKVSKQLSFSLSCRILTSHCVPGSGWSASLATINVWPVASLEIPYIWMDTHPRHLLISLLLQQSFSSLALLSSLSICSSAIQPIFT